MRRRLAMLSVETAPSEARPRNALSYLSDQ
jgi:hypothetical protein